MSNIFSLYSTGATAGLLAALPKLFSSSLNLALFILLIVSYWKIYEMAGEEGWASLIPYYSSYIRFKIAGRKILFWFDLACQILFPIAGIIVLAGFISALVSNTSYDHWAIVVVALLIATVSSMASFVFKIIMNIGLARNFGRSFGFAVGLIFLPHIFYSILAFSSESEYVGGYGDVPPVSEGMNSDGAYSSNSNSAGSFSAGSGDVNGFGGSNGTGNSDAAHTDTNLDSYSDAEEVTFDEYGEAVKNDNTDYVNSYNEASDSDDIYEDGIEVIEEFASADEPTETEYTNNDEFNDVFKNAINNSTDNSDHVSGDVE